MKVDLLSEVYPPRAGGAGWSTRALALALREAGHSVRVLTTSSGPPDLDGLCVRRLSWRGRKRLAIPRTFAALVKDTAAGTLLHAQHSLSALGALAGEHAARTVVTVRDHWPVCFWSTRMSAGALCPGCGWGPMTRCVAGRVRLPGKLAWTALPYMRTDLAHKRRALARAGAVVAVSEAVAAELRGLELARLLVLPNVVDAREAARVASSEPASPLPERFLLYVGKLEENKGVRLLVPAVAAARSGLPLVVLGEGPLAHTLRFEAASLGVELLLRGWTHRDDVLRALARAIALVFPSTWPEPLSRVLLEALALGTPLAAMETGGTREIVVDGQSGLLVPDAGGLAEAVARLAHDGALRTRLAEGARERARAFSPEALVPRYEALYRSLL